MSSDKFQQIFNNDTLANLFPSERANQFFEALYGDIEEGVYDISLEYKEFSISQNTLHFTLNLSERPGKCLACHLTQGLPEVFSRHPIIDIKGLVAEIDKLLGDSQQCNNWELGRTQNISRKLYAVPLTISLG